MLKSNLELKGLGAQNSAPSPVFQVGIIINEESDEEIKSEDL